MLIFRRYKVRNEERGFLFRDKEFVRVLAPGTYWFVDPLRKVRVDILSVRDVWVRNKDLDVIARSGALGKEAIVLDLADRERAVVSVDGRFEAVLKPGLYALWTVFRKVTVERVDTAKVRFESDRLAAILATASGRDALDSYTVEAGQIGLLFRDGKLETTLGPDTYAFWKGVGKVRLQIVDQREQVVDIQGQEIMTSDKVTLRMNAVVTYRVADAVKAVTGVDDYKQALYRDGRSEALATRAPEREPSDFPRTGPSESRAGPRVILVSATCSSRSCVEDRLEACGVLPPWCPRGERFSLPPR